MKLPGPLILLGATGLVLVLRVAASLSLSSSPLLIRPVLEDADYRARALEFASDGSEERLLPRGSVLYSAVAALLPGVKEGRNQSLFLCQAFLEGVTALLLMLWIRKRWGVHAAGVAGVLYALDPTGAFFASRFSPVVPATTAFVACLWVLDSSQREKATIRSAVGAGVLIALGFLLLPLPFLCLIAIELRRRFRELRRGSVTRVATSGLMEGEPAFRPGKRKPVRTAPPSRPLPRARPLPLWAWSILALLPIVLLSGILLIRHSILRDGGPVLAWGGGIAFHQAIDPATAGTPRALRPPSWQTEGSIATNAWEALGREGTHFDLFRFYATRAFQRAVENPLGLIGVLVTKALAAFSAFPIPDSLSAPFLYGQRGGPLIYGAWSFAILFGLGVAGWIHLKGDRLRDCLSAGLLAVFLACVLGMNSAANRQAALPLLAALGGGWITGAGTPGKSRFRLGSLLGLAGGIAFSLLTGWLGPTRALQNPSEDLRLLASTLAQQQNWRQAVPLLEKAVEADPRNIEARLSLAQGYQRDGLHQASEAALLAAYEVDSTHVGTLFALAGLEQRRSQLPTAIRYLDRICAQRPNNPLYLNELGQLLVRAGNFAQSETYFRRALQLKPDYEIARQNLEGIETYKQRLEGSLYPTEMRLPPDDPVNGAIPRMLQAMEAERWSEADSLIRWAEAERPSFVLPHWMRAAYHARRGERELATAALERCQRLAPGRPAVVELLANYYLQMGRPRDAERLLDESILAAEADSLRMSDLLRVKAHLLTARP